MTLKSAPEFKTLTSAPELEKLKFLTHEWRHVATMDSPGEWRWHGDLWETEMNRTYRVMRDTHDTVTQVHYRPGDGTALLFAALSKRGAPGASYEAAVAFLGGAVQRRLQAEAIRAAAADRRRRMLVA